MKTDDLLAAYQAALDALVAENRRALQEERWPGAAALAAAARAVVDTREALERHLRTLDAADRTRAAGALRTCDQQGEALSGLLIAANPYRRAHAETGWWWSARAQCPEALLALPALDGVPAELATHARTCAACADALVHAQALSALATRAAARSARVRPPPRRGWVAWGLGGSLAAAGAAGLVLALGLGGPQGVQAPVLLERGGDPSLTVYAIRKGRSVRVEAGRVLFTDDALRLEENAAGWPYLLVLAESRPGEGHVLFQRRSAPAGAADGRRLAAIDLPPGLLQALRGPIRLHAVWSAQPLAVPALVQALATGQPIPGRALVLPCTMEAP